MIVHEFAVKDYALGETLSSGQAFRWKEVNGYWEGIVDQRWVRLKESDRGIRAEVTTDVSNWDWLAHYLQVDAPIDQIIRSFPEDNHIRAAVAECRGLRLLRQDPWECLASFILSSTKQIVQIKQIVELLCRRFGESVAVPQKHEPEFGFPATERIARLSEDELRCCKMGFRAPYLKGSAQMIVSGRVNLEALREMTCDEAREELIRLPGVGRKIADCVLLFAYGFQEAFPIDVWVMKALRKLYFPKRRKSAKKLIEFTQNYFGPNAGYAQQYLFHYMRTRVGRRIK